MKKTKISELIKQLLDSKKDSYDFVDIIDLDNALNRHLHLGEIDTAVADSVDSYIRFWNRMDNEEEIPKEKREPIKIYIDSQGGDLMGSFTIIDTIKNSETPVWTINIGMAYSGGFFVFLAGHHRISYANASFLFHEGSTAQWGDANKFNNFADFYKRILKRLKNHVINNSKISEEEYEKHIKDDWWITPEEALEHGICDEII